MIIQLSVHEFKQLLSINSIKPILEEYAYNSEDDYECNSEWKDGFNIATLSSIKAESGTMFRHEFIKGTVVKEMYFDITNESNRRALSKMHNTGVNEGDSGLLQKFENSVGIAYRIEMQGGIIKGAYRESI